MKKEWDEAKSVRLERKGRESGRERDGGRDRKGEGRILSGRERRDTKEEEREE